jgi:hypothetical protein
MANILGAPIFAPAARLDDHFSARGALALERDADYDHRRDLSGLNRQLQSLFAVVNHAGEPVDVEAGIGHGFTSASDGLMPKLMLAKSF